MVMTLKDIKSVYMWLSVFTWSTRFIYSVLVVALAMSLVYGESYWNWWHVGATAAAYLLTDYLQNIISIHNARVLEIMAKSNSESEVE